MAAQTAERVRGKSLLVSQLAQQKRGSYSDDELFDEELDNDSELPEPERPVVPTKLPRITPSVSLSVVTPTSTLISQAEPATTASPVLKSLVITPRPSLPTVTTCTGLIANIPVQLPQNVIGLRTGRLENILLTESSPAQQSPPIFSLPKRGRPRGRPPKVPRMLLPLGGADDFQARSFCLNLPKRPRQPRTQKLNIPLLLPLRENHPPTNMALPPVDIASQFDVFNAITDEKKLTAQPSGGDENTTGPQASVPASGLHTSASSSSLLMSTSRMKTSTSGEDVDIQELRNHRRLNGYSLFVFMNKRKYESNVGTDEQADLGDSVTTSQKDNLKWQAIWSTLSDKERREWKAKARRILRQNQQRVKRDAPDDKDRRWSERRKLERQLAKNDEAFATHNLLDIAAYFQLLSDSFAGCAHQLEEVEGPVNTEGVESLLLDGLLSCLIPLVSLVSEEEALSSVFDKDQTSLALKHLTYILPI